MLKVYESQLKGLSDYIIVRVCKFCRKNFEVKLTLQNIFYYTTKTLVIYDKVKNFL